MSTPYHAKYFAHELTRQASGADPDRLSRALFDAQVDLNPHQIDAALFALRSPVSGGAILADEVGLGKTIEAGLALCQLWAERKRRLLVVCPASLRKQWALELEEKFNLPTRLLDGKTYRDAVATGDSNPLDTDAVVIMSIHFAARMAEELRLIGWHLAVVDEAHKLRNCYRESNKQGQAIRTALRDTHTVLLTATPLQNTLLELFGLSTLVDEYFFSDAPTFRSMYMGADADLSDLRERLSTICSRTLRKQVQEYVNYTARKCSTFEFEPSPEEDELYRRVSDLLMREDTYAVPSEQRHLLALIGRKLLASSTRAVAGTLDTLRLRLEALRDDALKPDSPLRLVDDVDDEYLQELLDEFESDDDELRPSNEPSHGVRTIDRQKLLAEIDELTRLADIARGIPVDQKTKRLLDALDAGFVAMKEQGASRKALIFTESRRTQNYLRDFLEANGYAGKVLTYSGGSAKDAKEIHDRWVAENPERASGSRAIDTRHAIVDHFEKHADIMIATEAGSEGINLQFCSLVINYDLPWNPQRIEQRIGRCHRYGQKHDVVVINFLNEKNKADQRVYELLSRKFTLFEGVFGASDEVLGALESGIDFERKVLDIYQSCRSPEEIEAAFDALRDSLEGEINEKMLDTRRKLMEHFDQEVHDRLKVRLEQTQIILDRFSRRFWALTRFVLDGHARFDDKHLMFQLVDPPGPAFDQGRYVLISRHAPGGRTDGDAGRLYRTSTPLGEFVLDQGKTCSTPVAEIVFDSGSLAARVSDVERLRGRTGWLRLNRLEVQSLEAVEHVLFSAFDDAGESIDQEACEKLFECASSVTPLGDPNDAAIARLDAESDRHIAAVINREGEANNQHFKEAQEKLERWAEDMEAAAEAELHRTKEQMKVLRRQARQASTLTEQKEIQDKLKKLEQQQRRQRQQIFARLDEISTKRDALIDELEARLAQKTERETLFTIRWAVR